MPGELPLLQPVRMERRSGGVALHTETSEGGLKELVLRWFTETQAQLVLNNGSFPDWFQGFAARKDTEDLLRDKALGCFLIRLSEKAIGYILSYKGHDRCRHFVITQDHDGQFVISGDCQTYATLTELIEHYKVSPIQPFGEYLTSSCHEVDTGELYDVVSYNSREKSGVSVQALRSLWAEKTDPLSDRGTNQRVQQHSDPPTVQPPALPLKSKNRKLTGAVSVDAMCLSQGLPPVPKRGIPLGFSHTGSLPETTSHPSETHTNPFNTTDATHPGDLCPPESSHSELTQVEGRSKSLPRLNNNMEEEEEEEEEYSNQLSSHSFTTSYSAAPLKATCHTYSLHDPRRDAVRASSSRSEQQGQDVEMLRSNPLYQTSGGPGGGAAGPPDRTYEQIPGEAAAVQANTYESLEDMKAEKPKSTWGKKNMKWKKFLPEYKKK